MCSKARNMFRQFKEFLGEQLQRQLEHHFKLYGTQNAVTNAALDALLTLTII